MAGRRRDMRAVPVTLVRGKNCFLVKSLMCGSREVAMIVLMWVRSTSCVMLGKKKSIIEARAKHVPRLLVSARRFIHINYNDAWMLKDVEL
jgi:hypothetical protein